jgi:hypothetical protein
MSANLTKLDRQLANTSKLFSVKNQLKESEKNTEALRVEFNELSKNLDSTKEKSKISYELSCNFPTQIIMFIIFILICGYIFGPFDITNSKIIAELKNNATELSTYNSNMKNQLNLSSIEIQSFNTTLIGTKKTLETQIQVNDQLNKEIEEMKDNESKLTEQMKFKFDKLNEQMKLLNTQIDVYETTIESIKKINNEISITIQHSEYEIITKALTDTITKAEPSFNDLINTIVTNVQTNVQTYTPTKIILSEKKKLNLYLAISTVLNKCNKSDSVIHINKKCESNLKLVIIDVLKSLDGGKEKTTEEIYEEVAEYIIQVVKKLFEKFTSGFQSKSNNIGKNFSSRVEEVEDGRGIKRRNKSKKSKRKSKRNSKNKSIRRRPRKSIRRDRKK